MRDLRRATEGGQIGKSDVERFFRNIGDQPLTDAQANHVKKTLDGFVSDGLIEKNAEKHARKTLGAVTRSTKRSSAAYAGGKAAQAADRAKEGMSRATGAAKDGLEHAGGKGLAYGAAGLAVLGAGGLFVHHRKKTAGQQAVDQVKQAAQAQDFAEIQGERGDVFGVVSPG